MVTCSLYLGRKDHALGVRYFCGQYQRGACGSDAFWPNAFKPHNRELTQSGHELYYSIYKHGIYDCASARTHIACIEC